MLKFKLLPIIFGLYATTLQAQTKSDTLTGQLANSGGKKTELLLKLAETNINTYPTRAAEQAEEAAEIARIENNKDDLAKAIILKIKILCSTNDIEGARKQMQYLTKISNRGDKELKARTSLCEADIEMAAGNYEKAVELYSNLSAECSKSGFYDIAIKAENQLGIIYRENKNDGLSQKSFLKAIEIESQSDFPELKAASLNFLGSHFWRIGQYNQALDYYQQSLEIRRQQGNDYDIVNSLINIGNTYQNMGRFDLAVEYQTKALQLSANWENQLPKAQIMNYIGNIYWRKSLYDSALVYYNKSFAIYNELGNEMKTASLNDNIGNAHKMNSRFDSAMIYYNKALEIRKSSNSQADIANSLSNIGSIYWQTAKYSQALDCYLQALVIREEIGNKADVAKSLNNIGLIYKELSDYNKALEYQNKALEIYKAIGNKALTASTLNHIGNVHRNAGNMELALECHMQALRLRQEIGDENAAANSSNNIGLIYRDLGEYEKAESFFNDAIATNRKSGNRQALGLALNNLGDTYARAGKQELSINQYNEALVIFEAMNDKRSIAITTQNIGEFYFETKQYGKAKHFLNRALKAAQDIDDIEIIKNVSYDNFKLYEATNETAKALESFKLYNTYRDTVSNSSNLQRMLEMQSLYEINVKEKEIELLKSKAENIALKLSGQQRLIAITSIAALLLMVLCVVVFINYRNKKRANEMLRKTFSIIAHDLRSPVAALSSLTSLLNQEDMALDEAERKELTANTEHLTKSTLQLLETLLEWSHSQNGDIVEYNPENLSVKSVANEVVQLSEMVAKNKELTLVNTIESDDLQVFADHKGVLLILRNLIANAIKFSHKGGQIIISAHNEADSVVIGVKDFGVGIAPDDLQRIVAGLNSDSKQGTMKEKGFGMGMRFCVDFVHANKGKMWAESEEGKYTIFYFDLPRAKAI